VVQISPDGQEGIYDELGSVLVAIAIAILTTTHPLLEVKLEFGVFGDSPLTRLAETRFVRFRLGCQKVTSNVLDDRRQQRSLDP
jgi:hypothetical protein